MTRTIKVLTATVAALWLAAVSFVPALAQAAWPNEPIPVWDYTTGDAHRFVQPLLRAIEDGTDGEYAFDYDDRNGACPEPVRGVVLVCETAEGEHFGLTRVVFDGEEVLAARIEINTTAHAYHPTEELANTVCHEMLHALGIRTHTVPSDSCISRVDTLGTTLPGESDIDMLLALRGDRIVKTLYWTHYGG